MTTTDSRTLNVGIIGLGAVIDWLGGIDLAGAEAVEERAQVLPPPVAVLGAGAVGEPAAGEEVGRELAQRIAAPFSSISVSQAPRSRPTAR